MVLLLASTAFLPASDPSQPDMAERSFEISLPQEGDQWWQSDVDPRFSLDGELFMIEPAAAPPCEAEMQACCAASREAFECLR
jgi:hypothetical protein